MPLRVALAVLCLLLVSPAVLAQEGGYAPIDPEPSSSSGSSGRRSRGSSDTRAEELLRPSTRPLFFVGAVGPTFFGINRAGKGGKGPGFRGPEGALARAKLSLELGYHFSGDFEGPAIGAAIEQSFDDKFYVFNPSFKFWWDIKIIDEYAIYVTPWAKAGYALAAACGGCPDHAFNVGIGAEGRIIFNDRWLALFRPIHIDTYLGNFFGETFWLNYSLLVGGGVTF